MIIRNTDTRPQSSPVRRQAWGGGVGLALLLLGCGTLANQSAGGAEESEAATKWRLAPSERSFELWSNPGGNLLSALAEVEASDRLSVLPNANSALGSLFAEVGAYYSAISVYQPFGATYVERTEQCESRQLPDAVPALCDAIGEEQIVIISELSHVPSHRGLGRSLLSCARDAGFGYLAVEGLEEAGTDLKNRGYVSRSQSGVYTREPQLAGLLGEAFRLGMVPVSYAAGPTCVECDPIEIIRQSAEQQARTLLAQTIDVDAEAKVFVWSGPRQAYKQTWGPPPVVTSLAAYVFEESGIEPYSIDQVTADANFGQPTGAYLATGPTNAACAGSYSPDTANGQPALNGVVVHVAPRDDEDRWAWLRTPQDQRVSLVVRCSSCAADERLLVQAFPAASAIEDHVPVDQAICTPGAACQLAARAGDYQVIVWSEDTEIASRGVALAPGSRAELDLD